MNSKWGLCKARYNFRKWLCHLKQHSYNQPLQHNNFLPNQCVHMVKKPNPAHSQRPLQQSNMLGIITAITGYPYDPWSWAGQVRIPTWSPRNNQTTNPQVLIHSYTYDKKSRIRTHTQPPYEREERNCKRNAPVGQRLEEVTNSNSGDLVTDEEKHSTRQ